MPDLEDEEQATVIDADKARSGVTGHHVRYVLGFGIAGLVAAFIIMALLS